MPAGRSPPATIWARCSTNSPRPANTGAEAPHLPVAGDLGGDGEAAIDDDGGAGHVAAGIAGEIDGDAGKVLRHAPAPYRQPRHVFEGELLGVDPLGGDRRLDGAAPHRYGADLVLYQRD